MNNSSARPILLTITNWNRGMTDTAEKPKRKTHAVGNWTPLTIRMKSWLKHAIIKEVGRRIGRDEYGVGWKEMPTSRSVITETLARALNVQLPQPEAKEVKVKDVESLMCELPEELMLALRAKSLETGNSMNDIINEILAVEANEWAKAKS